MNQEFGEFEACYNYNNIIYNIITTKDIHEKLQNDPEFFKAYLGDHMTSNEAVGITDEENDPKIGNFTWTKQSTKLLLQKFFDRKTRFRDPKIKKKVLWTEIVNEFKLNNYNINEDILDRKMRNLKQSYKNIKDNNKKTSTGRGRINWEWYDTMEDIFKDDRTINFGTTLSSMKMITQDKGLNTTEQRRIEECFLPSNPSTSILPLNASTSTLLSNPSTSTCDEERTISSGRSDVEDVAENIIPVGLASDISSNPSPKNNSKYINKQKATKSKSLYELRKRLIDHEERRLQDIEKLTEALQEHNRLQQERNDILKKLVVQANNK